MQVDQGRIMKETISKFAPPVVLSLLGLTLMISGGIDGQNSMFMFGSGAILITGIFSLLYALNIARGALKFVVLGVLLLLSGSLIYSNFYSIKQPIEFLAEKESRYEHIVQRLKDIRVAQLAFKKVNGKYTKNFGELLDFIKNDSIPEIISNGNVPDGMSEDSALFLGKISRDTVLIPVQDSIYGVTYMATRSANIPLDVDKLPFVPFVANDVQFKMEAGEIDRNSVLVQVFQVSDPAPFDPTDPMKVGSMTEPSTAGNWKEER